MDNFFKQPVGRAVLYLNDFHNGKFLSELNRISGIIPDDVKGMASIVSATPEVTPEMVEYTIDTLGRWANQNKD